VLDVVGEFVGAEHLKQIYVFKIPDFFHRKGLVWLSGIKNQNYKKRWRQVADFTIKNERLNYEIKLLDLV
jgi:hypothetical protein